MLFGYYFNVDGEATYANDVTLFELVINILESTESFAFVVLIRFWFRIMISNTFWEVSDEIFR